MNPFLLYKQKDFHNTTDTIQNKQLLQDLQLDQILRTMAGNDQFLYHTTRQIILHSETEVETIFYRQRILKDGIHQPGLFKFLYSKASKVCLESSSYRSHMKPNFSRNIPVREKLKVAVNLLETILSSIQEIKDRGKGWDCRSEGLKAMLYNFEFLYDKAFMTNATAHLTILKRTISQRNILIGARIGNGLKGTGYKLRELDSKPHINLKKNRIKPVGQLRYDQSIRDIEEVVLQPILRMIKKFIDDVLVFFKLLRFESAFYLACVHLYQELSDRKCPISFPQPKGLKENRLYFRGLYHLQLALNNESMLVPNDLETTDNNIFIIYGVNQGGKTTFLRSIGLSQLMMQCGMFVPASCYESNVCDRIFTHFTKPEDHDLISGKLDEELARLNDIVDHMTPYSFILLNEPFSSTTETEGTLIAKELVLSFYELNIRAFVVTHFYKFAKWASTEYSQSFILLSPERDLIGKRTYKIICEQPSPTSFGKELFESELGFFFK